MKGFGRLSSRGSNDLRTAFTDSDALDFQDFDGFFVPAGFVVQVSTGIIFSLPFNFVLAKAEAEKAAAKPPMPD